MSPLRRLEAEVIHILRETVAEAKSPVMLFSAGKDSTVMAHLALRAFYPAKPPFPLLHVDSTWESQSLGDSLNQPSAKMPPAASASPADYRLLPLREKVPEVGMRGTLCPVAREV